jgi:predicted transcriptional regulator
MRDADVSQLPVIDGGRIVGLIDESDKRRPASFLDGADL